MESKHTPGPWVVEWNGDARKGMVIRAPAAGRPSAPNPGVCRVYDVLPEREENGKLIAAAPDLLAALQAMLERYTVNTPDGYSDPGGDITRARAAVAKALE